jgi:hypothetical protein
MSPRAWAVALIGFIVSRVSMISLSLFLCLYVFFSFFNDRFV